MKSSSMSYGLSRLALLLSCLALSGCLGGLIRSVSGGMSPELRERGVAATATILEIWDTGWTINDNTVIGMAVRVEPQDAAPFAARIEKVAISRIAIPQFQPGKPVAVVYDPRDPSIVAVDTGGSARSRAGGGSILGITARGLDAGERSRLRRDDGIVVESVAAGSAADEARLAPGDVIVAVDGNVLPDTRAVPALIASLAGKRVRIDLLRDGRPLSVSAQLRGAASAATATER